MRAIRVATLVLTLCVVVVPAGPLVAQTDSAASPTAMQEAPFDAPAAATVLLFTAVDCPISNRYTPEIRRVADRYAARGVRLWVVYANAGERPDAAREHAAAFAHDLPVVLDGNGALADRSAATVTPEAAVFDRAGRLVYHGRIDDRYVDFGVERRVPTSHELDDAIGAVLAGRAPRIAAVPAVGCAIVRRQP